MTATELRKTGFEVSAKIQKGESDMSNSISHLNEAKQKIDRSPEISPARVCLPAQELYI